MRGGTRPHHKPSTSHPSNYCVNAPRVPCPITGPSKARRTSLSSCLLPLITTPTQATRNGAMPVLIWVLILGSQGWLSTIHFGWCLTLGKLRHKLGSCALWRSPGQVCDQAVKAYSPTAAVFLAVLQCCSQAQHSAHKVGFTGGGEAHLADDAVAAAGSLLQDAYMRGNAQAWLVDICGMRLGCRLEHAHVCVCQVGQ
eukprot:1157711-Pelagomonas_calceolata.AAC.2